MRGPSRPRVLQVLQPEDGGVAQHVLELSLGLHERDFEVEVAAPARCTALPPLREAGVRVHTLDLVRKPGLRDARPIRALRALDRERHYDLVHAHSSKAGAIARMALPRAGRLVYTPHCFAFCAGPEIRLPARAAYWAAEQLLVPRTGTLIAVSDWEARKATRALAGARSRLTTIHNGTPACATAEPHPALRAFAAGLPLAVLVSKLRPQKDPLALVRAVAALEARGEPPGRVAIVGDGELEGAVRRLIAEQGVGEAVRWFPFEGATGPYLAAADLVVAPSRWESLPLALLEAMACGLPVLATDVGGVAEVVQDGITGELVPPDHPSALADALARLLIDGERRARFGDAGRRVVEERFGLDPMVERTAARYRGMLASRGGPPKGAFARS